MTTGNSAVGRPIAIAHVIYRLGIGGLENGLVNLINRLPPQRFRHVVICLTEATEFRRRLTRPDVEVISLHKPPGKNWRIYTPLWRTLRRVRPDILHTRNLATLDCQLIGWLAGVPRRVHGEHGWDTFDLHGQSTKYIALRRFVSHFVTGFVAMSRHMEQWLKEVVGLDPRNIMQLYNGVDVEHFAVPERYRIPSAGGAEAPVIGTVARLEVVKDPATLVEAFARLVHEGDAHARLRIVGDGALRTHLEQRVRTAGIWDRCEFAGASDDVAGELKRIDVFALTSLNEGISNTILEAMAAGLPVVATRVGGNPELVVPGITGELVPPGDPETLCAALNRYVSDATLRQRHGEAARRRVVETFGIDAMVSRYAALYDSLFERHALPVVGGAENDPHVWNSRHL
jgi:sugar transferase (PEP-CTERM/EpsH1 system associated)